MPAFCRICRKKDHKRSDVYVACYNCGSLTCDSHHRWFPKKQKAYCTECIPHIAQQGVSQAADAMRILATQEKDSSILQNLAKQIRANARLKELLWNSQEQDLLITIVEALDILDGIFANHPISYDDPFL